MANTHRLIGNGVIQSKPRPPTLPGDANQDGRVGLADYLIFKEHWGEATTRGALDGDFNGDGIVDRGDLDILTKNWGRTAGT